jgi:hypothetical protein
MHSTPLPPDEGPLTMSIRAAKTLPTVALIAALCAMACMAHAMPAKSCADKTLGLLAQATPPAPAPAASAPAADAQPENRETPARPAARRRGVGVVISMNAA